MNKPRLLDTYCGAGGAAKGYQRAGFHVTGVDINPQPNYCGDTFVQGDAVEFIKEHGHEFDAHHASPPCQDGSTLTQGNRQRAGWTDDHVDWIASTRDALRATGLPFVIENVPGNRRRLIEPIRLCGEMFGLAVIRHRFFEAGGWRLEEPKHKKHRGRVSGMRHSEWFTGPYFQVYGDGGGKGTVAEWQQAMGIYWTDVRKEIAEAIPPVYAQFVGTQLMWHLSR